MSFKKLNLHPTLQDNISSLGYKEATPIQRQAIPVALKGKDLLGIAKTGSGKTASYVLPILQLLHTKASANRNRQPRALVLVPTRELAMQVLEVCRQLGRDLPNPIKSMAVYGGVSINPQMKAIFKTEVLIATLGRLLDLVRSNAVDLSKVEMLVMDEADKILNLGFREEMDEVLKLLPKQRQNLLFSATLNKKLSDLNRVLLSDPETIEIKDKIEDAEQINLEGYFVSNERKGPLLRFLIRDQGMQQVLIFTSSGPKADTVARKLQKNGIQAMSIHGKKSQAVATDLISRGIDIQGLPYVINYELPRSPKDFVHRVGRTGRADAEGLAITFVTREETHHFKVILKKMKRYMDMIDSEKMDLW